MEVVHFVVKTVERIWDKDLSFLFNYVESWPICLLVMKQPFFQKVSFDVYWHFFSWFLFYECTSVAFKQMEILIL